MRMRIADWLMYFAIWLNPRVIHHFTMVDVKHIEDGIEMQVRLKNAA